VDVCDGSEPLDALTILSTSLAGDTLSVTAQASGGCEDHEVGLCWDGSFISSSTGTMTGITMWHESNDDPCESIVSLAAEVDVTPIQTDYNTTFSTTTGTVVLDIDPGSSTETYSW
jgi:hypothetical protein